MISISAATKYRYAAPNRSTDATTTKQFRKRLRAKILTILECDRAYCTVQAEDGEIFTWVPQRYLKPINGQGGAA